MTNRKKYKPWAELSSHYIRNLANNKYIYNWMDKNGIGKSLYGQYLDSLGKKPGTYNQFYHRLYGHHLIYDFPIKKPEKIPKFLEHVLVSDFFTQQGLPIIPGEILNSTELGAIFHNISLDWNFINAFDLLSGTFAIYNNYKISSNYFNQTASIEKIDELAKMLGITGIHIALGLSTCNPLLVISSIISSAGCLVGLLNNPYKVYFKCVSNQYELRVITETMNIESVLNKYDIQNVVDSYDIKKNT